MPRTFLQQLRVHTHTHTPLDLLGLRALWLLWLLWEQEWGREDALLRGHRRSLRSQRLLMCWHLVIDKLIRDICSLECHLRLVFGSLHLFVLQVSKPRANFTVVVIGLWNSSINQGSPSSSPSTHMLRGQNVCVLPLPWESHTARLFVIAVSNDCWKTHPPACMRWEWSFCSMEQPSPPNRHFLFLGQGEPRDIVAINIHLKQELPNFLNNVDL